MIARKSSIAFFGFALALSATTAFADGWSDQLFDKRSHDFGYVARGKVKKTFTITNKLNRPVHILSATPSCQVCTVAKPEKDWLQPGESTTLEAVLDTHKFTGPKSVAIDVVFDKPQYGSTRLNLYCNARTDIVLSPGEFNLGTVKRGDPITKTMEIKYAGNNDWKIASVSCSNPAIETELEETQRSGGIVGYLLRVTLKSDTQAGLIRDRIVLGINDAYSKAVDVAIHGTVQSDVTLSPAVLSVGNISADSTMTKQVLVRGVRPFRITAIDGNGGPFQIETPEEAKQLHVLTVTLKPGHDEGDVTQEFQITTDMEGEAPLKLTVSAKLTRRPEPRPAAGGQ